MMLPIKFAIASKVPIVTPEDVYEEYQCLLNGRNILDVDDFSGECSRRNTVEIILIQQMLLLGGFEYEFVLEPGYYNQKERKLIQEGLLLVSVDSIWQNEAKAMEQDVYISPPIIREGEYIAGLYTVKSNRKALAIKDVESIRKLSYVSSQKWTNDWYVLESIGVESLVDEPSWTAQVQMVGKGLVDVVLLPFSPLRDMAYNYLDNWYFPIPNYYVRLPESRHVIISKKHPLGEQAYLALIKGMKILRASGLISKAYRQSGLFNRRVESWRQVNDLELKNYQ